MNRGDLHEKRKKKEKKRQGNSLTERIPSNSVGQITLSQNLSNSHLIPDNE